MESAYDTLSWAEAVVQGRHVLQRADGNASDTNLALGDLVIRIESVGGRQVDRDDEAVGTVFVQIPDASVGLLWGAKAHLKPACPNAGAVHARIRPHERIFARLAQVSAWIETRNLLRTVTLGDLEPRVGQKDCSSESRAIRSASRECL